MGANEEEVRVDGKGAGADLLEKRRKIAVFV